MFLKNEFSNRLVQVSLFAGIVYYITAYPIVFESARKYFPIKFKKTHHLLIFHTFVFAVLMYILTYFVFDPIVRVVEGAEGAVNGAEGAVNGADAKGADGADGGNKGSEGAICTIDTNCINGLTCTDGRCQSESTTNKVKSQGN